MYDFFLFFEACKQRDNRYTQLRYTVHSRVKFGDFYGDQRTECRDEDKKSNRESV